MTPEQIHQVTFTLDIVRIMMKNQDRREHEEKVYIAVLQCLEMLDVLDNDVGKLR